MFRIRQDHIDSFRAARLSDFEDKALHHLRRDLVQQTEKLTDDEILHRVREGVRRATSFGLRSERQIMCFIDTSFLLGTGFEEDPKHEWARDVLQSEKLGPTDKGNLLLATACAFANEQKQGNS